MKRIIDLTHPYRVGMTTYPGTLPIDINSIGDTNYNFIYFLYGINHIGTHCDAPAHMIKGEKTIDQISIDTFMGEAVIVDVDVKDSFEIGPDVLKGHEIREGNIVLFRTGYSRLWDKEEYIKKSPYLSEELAKELVKHKVKAVGLDFISPDPVRDDITFPVHKILLASNIIIIENLNNLDKISQKRVWFSAAPILIEGADGAFTRAYAIVEE
ncbi:cyclase family protein [Thermoanaerobacter wiegelii]|uniref:Cyclase family protein n=1 Tax=Thermoanaerobacter wiegelii Rt8.B1 TaxID=697303 RepID=G2MU22_9THEO|nr:cyclase family protein [Thermoanaerobacter wiegelii]AEM79849.1 cyclase family protein [Thermoanaerobacter wiegelii Rt8.B1]